MKAIAGVIAAAALATVSVLAIGVPAQASFSQCTSNRACAWIDANFSGAFGSWTSNQSSLPGFHDNISSTGNNRTAYIGFFSDPGYGGSVFQVPPGGGGYFNWLDPRNNSFDSLYFY
ncbi:hypothetical protein BKA04_001365 [Cryobacterium mesophilum]|uniref:Peptidase inhibitor family I36 n=1 Tax=Terrimesophilobacter mesophilus TaxID=433647 RepID=A0A4V3I9L3_9MICO|nr:peptidase inhibitor family I36 protein [Terrimesophilobacter mesophilus]MBB5633142.1 hypothetical protein [Terrimesophilobacter mesophilus]TFB79898.1 hypothetical protein E3N84_07475 [Terrimesophilobacter mesophilus]